MSDIVRLVREFISENFMFEGGGGELEDDASFLERGIIDSTGVLELVDWLEEEFGLEIDDDDLTRENLDSVNNLRAFITRKKAQFA